MRYVGRVALLLATSLVAVLGVIAPGAALAEPVTKEACAKEVELKIPSAKDAAGLTPVVMVHGYTGNTGIWNQKGHSLVDKVNVAKGAQVAKLFDYSKVAGQWVTVGDTALRLAKTIICASKLYDGKRVILIAHSMGGLLARQALSLAAYGSFAKDVAGLVITIGVPHKGTGLGVLPAVASQTDCIVFATLANPFGDAVGMCNEVNSGNAAVGMSINSDALAKLPKFPKGVLVKAIAGDVAWQVCVSWGCSPSVDQGGDLAVSVDSATSEYTQTNRGDGKRVLYCKTSVAILPLTDAWCEHSHIVQAGVTQTEIQKSVAQYLASKPKPAPTATPSPSAAAKPPFDLTPNFASLSKDSVTLFDRLTIHPGKGWIGAMSEPDVVVNYVDNTICTADAATCPHIYFINLASSEVNETGEQMLQKWRNEKEGRYCQYGRIKGPLAVKIGGRSAQAYEQGCVGDEDAVRNAWLLPGKLFVYTSEIGAQSNIIQGALQSATWK